MANLSNEELIQKATIVANDLASGGKLNPAQSDRFIDFVIDETVLKNNARVVRFRNESLEIDKIGVGRRVSLPKSEASDPSVRRGITTSKITLTPKEVMTPFEVGDNFRELNIEGDNVEETIIRMMATQTANDLEEGAINGNKLGAARLQSELLDDGSTTQYIRDSFQGLWDGWSLLADSANVLDADGQNIGLAILSRAIRALPTKFRRNRKNLRWFMSPDLWQIYQEKLATRATALGDSAANGGEMSQGPFGIPAIATPLWEFEPITVEHVQLSGTTAVALKSKNITDVVVTASTLGNVPTTPFTAGAGNDYVVDLAAGTIARDAAGNIGDGDTVKVTYRAAPQILLTHRSNMVLGIGRDIRIEKDRDIYKGVNQYAITTKADVQFEELDAIVKVRNVGKGV